MTGWLASVVDASEARLALAAGASIIDAKNPKAGALGALPAATVRAIVSATNDCAPVSATVGDFPDMDPDAVLHAARIMAYSGADYVKVGLFPAPRLLDCLAALAPLARQQCLVGVLFADREPDFRLIGRLAEAGFVGAMLDTADKGAGGLLDHMAIPRLAEFAAAAGRRGLLCGLAGSLKVADIPALKRVDADLLGFRGALCDGRMRTRGLDGQAVAAVAAAMRD